VNWQCELCYFFTFSLSLSLSLLLAIPGSEFVASMIFETKNGTGTGEIFWSIDTQDGMPVAVNQIVEARQPGTYNVSLTFVAERHGYGSGPCEEWYTGNCTLHGGERSLIPRLLITDFEQSSFMDSDRTPKI